PIPGAGLRAGRRQARGTRAGRGQTRGSEASGPRAGTSRARGAGIPGAGGLPARGFRRIDTRRARGTGSAGGGAGRGAGGGGGGLGGEDVQAGELAGTQEEVAARDALEAAFKDQGTGATEDSPFELSDGSFGGGGGVQPPAAQPSGPPVDAHPAGSGQEIVE